MVFANRLAVRENSGSPVIEITSVSKVKRRAGARKWKLRGTPRVFFLFPEKGWHHEKTSCPSTQFICVLRQGVFLLDEVRNVGSLENNMRIRDIHVESEVARLLPAAIDSLIKSDSEPEQIVNLLSSNPEVVRRLKGIALSFRGVVVAKRKNCGIGWGSAPERFEEIT